VDCTRDWATDLDGEELQGTVAMPQIFHRSMNTFSKPPSLAAVLVRWLAVGWDRFIVRRMSLKPMLSASNRFLQSPHHVTVWGSIAVIAYLGRAIGIAGLPATNLHELSFTDMERQPMLAPFERVWYGQTAGMDSRP